MLPHAEIARPGQFRMTANRPLQQRNATDKQWEDGSENDLVHLTQRRVTAEQYEYRATKRAMVMDATRPSPSLAMRNQQGIAQITISTCTSAGGVEGVQH